MEAPLGRVITCTLEDENSGRESLHEEEKLLGWMAQSDEA